MQTTIDMAGRVVIPKAIRNEAGLLPGSTLEVFVDGSGVRLQATVGTELVRRGDRLVIPSASQPITDDDVRELRLADQR